VPVAYLNFHSVVGLGEVTKVTERLSQDSFFTGSNPTENMDVSLL
jgi:hypothetical protein